MKDYKPNLHDILTYVTRYKTGNLKYELARHAAYDGYTFYCWGKDRPVTHIEFTSLDTLDTEALVKKMEQFVEDNEAIYTSPLYKALS